MPIAPPTTELQAQRPPRALALDVGRVRIGLAATDARGEVAQPHSVLVRRGTKPDVAAIVRLCQQLEIGVVVVGLPPQQGGVDAGSHGLCTRFAHALASAVAVPVGLIDEADTTAQASDELRLLGLRAARRRRDIDKHAAKVMLDRFLAGEPVQWLDDQPLR